MFREGECLCTKFADPWYSWHDYPEVVLCILEVWDDCPQFKRTSFQHGPCPALYMAAEETLPTVTAQLQALSRQLVSENASNASTTDPLSLAALLFDFTTLSAAATASCKSEADAASLLPKQLGAWLCVAWTWLHRTLQHQQHQQQLFLRVSFHAKRSLVAITTGLEATCVLFEHLLSTCKDSKDKHGSVLKQAAAACLEPVMRRGPMQTLLSLVDEVMQLQPRQRSEVTDALRDALTRVFSRIIVCSSDTKVFPLSCLRNPTCVRSFASLCHQAWASVEPLTQRLPPDNSLLEDRKLQQLCGRLGPEGQVMLLRDPLSVTLGITVPDYFAKLADVVCHCYSRGDVGDSTGEPLSEPECLRAGVMGGVLAITRTLTLQQLAWQVEPDLPGMPDVHLSYISAGVRELQHYLQRCHPWARTAAAAAAREARDGEQELLGKLHNLAWSVLALRDRQLQRRGRTARQYDADLEALHEYAAEILTHLEGRGLLVRPPEPLPLSTLTDALASHHRDGHLRISALHGQVDAFRALLPLMASLVQSEISQPPVFDQRKEDLCRPGPSQQHVAHELPVDVWGMLEVVRRAANCMCEQSLLEPLDVRGAWYVAEALEDLAASLLLPYGYRRPGGDTMAAAAAAASGATLAIRHAPALHLAAALQLPPSFALLARCCLQQYSHECREIEEAMLALVGKGQQADDERIPRLLKRVGWALGSVLQGVMALVWPVLAAGRPLQQAQGQGQGQGQWQGQIYGQSQWNEKGLGQGRGQPQAPWNSQGAAHGWDKGMALMHRLQTMQALCAAQLPQLLHSICKFCVDELVPVAMPLVEELREHETVACMGGGGGGGSGAASGTLGRPGAGGALSRGAAKAVDKEKREQARGEAAQLQHQVVAAWAALRLLLQTTQCMEALVQFACETASACFANLGSRARPRPSSFLFGLVCCRWAYDLLLSSGIIDCLTHKDVARLLHAPWRHVGSLPSKWQHVPEEVQLQFKDMRNVADAEVVPAVLTCVASALGGCAGAVLCGMQEFEAGSPRRQQQEGQQRQGQQRQRQQGQQQQGQQVGCGVHEAGSSVHKPDQAEVPAPSGGRVRILVRRESASETDSDQDQDHSGGVCCGRSGNANASNRNGDGSSTSKDAAWAGGGGAVAAAGSGRGHEGKQVEVGLTPPGDSVATQEVRRQVQRAVEGVERLLGLCAELAAASAPQQHQQHQQHSSKPMGGLRQGQQGLGSNTGPSYARQRSCFSTARGARLAAPMKAGVSAAAAAAAPGNPVPGNHTPVPHPLAGTQSADGAAAAAAEVAAEAAALIQSTGAAVCMAAAAAYRRCHNDRDRRGGRAAASGGGLGGSGNDGSGGDGGSGPAWEGDALLSPEWWQQADIRSMVDWGMLHMQLENQWCMEASSGRASERAVCGNPLCQRMPGRGRVEMLICPGCDLVGFCCWQCLVGVVDSKQHCCPELEAFVSATEDWGVGAGEEGEAVRPLPPQRHRSRRRMASRQAVHTDSSSSEGEQEGGQWAGRAGVSLSSSGSEESNGLRDDEEEGEVGESELSSSVSDTWIGRNGASGNGGLDEPGGLRRGSECGTERYEGRGCDSSCASAESREQEELEERLQAQALIDSILDSFLHEPTDGAQRFEGKDNQVH